MNYQPPDVGGPSKAIEVSKNFKVFADKAQWQEVEDKPGFAAYVAQKTAGRLDYGYLREVAGSEGARDLLRQAALQPHVGPPAKQALRAAANEIAGELFHQPPQP